MSNNFIDRSLATTAVPRKRVVAVASGDSEGSSSKRARTYIPKIDWEPPAHPTPNFKLVSSDGATFNIAKSALIYHSELFDEMFNAPAAADDTVRQLQPFESAAVLDWALPRFFFPDDFPKLVLSSKDWRLALAALEMFRFWRCSGLEKRLRRILAQWCQEHYAQCDEMPLALYILGERWYDYGLRKMSLPYAVTPRFIENPIDHVRLWGEVACRALYFQHRDDLASEDAILVGRHGMSGGVTSESEWHVDAKPPVDIKQKPRPRRMRRRSSSPSYR